MPHIAVTRHVVIVWLGLHVPSPPLESPAPSVIDILGAIVFREPQIENLEQEIHLQAQEMLRDLWNAYERCETWL